MMHGSLLKIGFPDKKRFGIADLEAEQNGKAKPVEKQGMKLKGTVWSFGDNVDTDLIIPGRFLNRWDQDSLARHCFADLRPEFAEKVKKGDVIFAGYNFGCGSSREHAPLAIRAVGIGVIVARSFARIFYRNACNIGLPVVESEEAADFFSEGDIASVDLESGVIQDRGGIQRAVAVPIPEFMRQIILSEGLVAFTRKKRPGPLPGGTSCRKGAK
jgi:3-isopropylmalate dehydratase small subunit